MSNKHHSIEISSCVMDPQTQLSDALANKNIKEFRVAFDLGADPLRLDNNHLSIFDKALSTAGCAEFVEECLQRGCSPNYRNPHLVKYAISFATDSQDPQILRSLLRHPNVMVDKKYHELTPLNSLAKNLNNENVSNAKECMKCLLDYGASPNIPNQADFTPLHFVARNRKLDDIKKREIVEMFLSYPDIDLDTYREGELREKLEELYPDLRLPEARSTTEVTMEKLLSYIKCGDTEKFKEQFPQYQLNISDKDNLKNTLRDENVPLFLEAIRKGHNEAFDMILASGVNYNAVLKGNSPMEVATIYGNSHALRKLLELEDLELRLRDYPLITVIRKMNEQPAQEYCDYRKCFYTLLESDRIDINEMDKTRSTPLHYAVKYRNTEAIRELLKRGAYIGVKSRFNELPIDGMSPELLEDHFDHCISSNGARVGDESFEILVNFMNLMPQGDNKAKHKAKHHLREEMAPIAFIAKSKEHRHLLQHPLVTSFLFLKWHRLSTIFYINFLLYFFFAVSIIAHTVLKFRESDSNAATVIFGLISWVGIFYMILREAIQFVMSPVHYFRSATNYMEVVLIILAIMTCTEPTYDHETQRIIAVFTMLLIAVELCLLVGSLPVLSISTHMLMLEAVCKSFLKSFTLYSIFVITFSLCFYILFGKPQVDEDGNPITPEDDDFNKFSNPLAAMIKTIVMLTGEFDAGDLQFDTLYSYLLFLLFVFLMTIVLFNLLNGLAVSDTQAIKGQAELNGAICRTQLLTRYEEVLTGRSERSSFIVNHEPFRSICRRLMNIYPNYRHIAILPNDSNKIFIPVDDTYEMKELGVQLKNNSFHPLPSNDGDKVKKLLDAPVQFLPCLCSCITNKCSEMDRRTVKLAMAVLEQKTIKMENRKRMQDTENRLRNIESKMNEMFHLLKAIKNDMN
ncbi:transient receptor potential cation channel protein painless [Musca domestica]|uniref:Transient receptor potential cation channel protein painless n=1 Tax=Musca domestica TaxID=7370 RepID=A0A1I8N6T7_MUSDO|nr:transient receptor potential cation channel protein painless [Musca domestica]XP_005178198.1 transient receptor potential cation channel protein painless [Musca domestica]XP_011290338.1 transient receptor potential cation channel protein painless [Musca domestica]